MKVKNTKAKFLLEDVDFGHEGAHLAYTVGSGAASMMNEAYLLKSEDINLSEEDKQIVDSLVKSTDTNTEITTDSEESISKDDTGIEIQEDDMSELQSIDKAQLDELLKAQEELQVLKLEKAEALKTEKEVLVKSAGFIDNVEVIVEAIVKSTEGSLIEDLISKSVAAIELVKAQSAEELEIIKSAHKLELHAAGEALEVVKAAADVVKEEFAAPQTIEGDNTSITDNDAKANKKATLAEFIKNKNK